MTWGHARDAVKDAYDRTIQLREERAQGREDSGPDRRGPRPEAGRHRAQDHRRAGRARGGRHRASADLRACGQGDLAEEDIVIPVKEERVSVTKKPVVTEEVTVGKRKVRGTEHVDGDGTQGRAPQVAEEGDVKVKGKRPTGK